MNTDNENIIILNKINIASLLKASKAFNEAISIENPSQITKDACIKRFEFTFELCWKTMKKVLAEKGIFLNSPKPILRESAKEGMIDDLNKWFKLLENRNQSAHIYDQNIADDIYYYLPEFKLLSDNFIKYLYSIKDE